MALKQKNMFGAKIRLISKIHKPTEEGTMNLALGGSHSEGGIELGMNVHQESRGQNILSREKGLRTGTEPRQGGEFKEPPLNIQ